MGLTKSMLFSDNQNELALVFKALGHPARIKILEHLLSVNSCICGDIVNVVNLAQPTISQHLKELKQAGLIQGQIEGRNICYCVNPNKIQELSELFDEMKSQLKSKSSCCN
ncbi:MAG: hypothetical protein RL264_39 [Bacteroidota bacterium]|jgi:DNA-binding transcriptional ArsR family regulator